MASLTNESEVEMHSLYQELLDPTPLFLPLVTTKICLLTVCVLFPASLSCNMSSTWRDCSVVFIADPQCLAQ